jgi:[acyl-carrier-protein] S-malonyltransferase
VLWQQSVERIVGEGVTTFVELGPGGVLCGLVRKTARRARAFPVESPGSLEAALAALSGEAAAEA